MPAKPPRKTPTPEKVRRRLFERWEVIRRRPDYREAYRKRDLTTLAQYGIDADPDSPAPFELLDLLKATHTDYSIDTGRVISGVLPLYETPWTDEQGKQQWRCKREVVFVLDPEVTLEEIREGIEHVLKFRRRYWVKARRLIGPVPLEPVRLINPNKVRDPEADRMRAMLTGYKYKTPFRPLLIVDPLQPLDQMRKEIHVLLKEWAAKRGRLPRRWRRTTARDLRAFDFTLKALTQIGKRPGRGLMAKNLGWSPEQARRAIERARCVIAPPEHAALVEHLLRCPTCQASRSCPLFDSLFDRVAGISRWPRERPASQRLDRHPDEEVADEARHLFRRGRAGSRIRTDLGTSVFTSEVRFPFPCPECSKTVRSRAAAQKEHRPCAEAILAKKRHAPA